MLKKSYPGKEQLGERVILKVFSDKERIHISDDEEDKEVLHLGNANLRAMIFS